MTLIGSKTSTFSHSSSRYIKVLVEAEVVSQDVATNSAQVVFKARITPDAINVNGNYMVISCSSAKVDGQTVSNKTQAYSKRVELMSGQSGYDEILYGGVLWESNPVTITYGSNRQKTVSVSVAYGASLYSTKEVYNSSYGYYEEVSTLLGSTSATQTISWALPELPAYAVLSAVSTEITDDEGVGRIFSYVVPTGTTNVKIGALFSDGTTAISFADVPAESGYYYFTFNNVSEEDKQRIWAKTLAKGLTSIQITFRIKSYDPTAKVNHDKAAPNSTKLTIVNYMPTVEPELWDTNPVTIALTTGTNAAVSNKIVKHFSKVAFDPHAEAKKGAGIDSIEVSNGGTLTSNLNHIFEDVINSVFTFTVTDTYGRKTSVDTDLSPSNWVNYTKLTSNIKLSDMAADGDVSVTVSGKYFNGSFGAQDNTLSLVCTAVPTRGDTITKTITNITPTMSGNDYTYEFMLEGLSYINAYTVTVVATDKLMSAESGSSVVAPEPIFDWGREDFNFNVPVAIQGDLDLNGNLDVSGTVTVGGISQPTIVAQGTSGNWTYRKWSDGVAECWSIVTLNTAITTAWGSMYVGATKMSKVNYPTNLFNAKPVETVTVQSPNNAVWVFAESGSTGVNSSTATGIYNICRPNQITAASNYYLSFYVRGKWK